MGKKVIILLSGLFLGSIVHAELNLADNNGEPDNLAEAIEMYNQSTREIREAGAPPLNRCIETSLTASSTPACTEFFDYACENREGTQTDGEQENIKIMDTFNGALSDFYDSSGISAEYRGRVARANANNKTPQFAETVSETVTNFSNQFCKDKENTAANRTALANAFHQRFTDANEPLYNKDSFFNTLVSDFEEKKARCHEICKRNSSNTRQTCNTRCNDSNFDYVRLSTECRRSATNYNNDTKRCLAEKAIDKIFNFMSTKSFSLKEMCQEMSNKLVQANRSYFRARAETSYNALNNTQKTQLATRVSNAFFPENVKKSVSKMYGTVKTVGNAMVNRWARSSGGMSKNLTSKLGEVKLNWDIPTDTFSNLFSRSTSMNAVYTRSANDVSIYGGMTAQDPYQMMFVLAHEYGHALDNNVAGTSGKEDSTIRSGFSRFNGCFSKSTGHRRGSGSNRYIQHTVHAEHNQLGECKGDFLGTEIFYNMLQNHTPALSTAEKKKAVMQTVLSCSDKGGRRQSLGAGGNPDAHPPWKDRAEKIIMGHPGFRDLFGCSKDTNKDPYYCVGGSTSPNYVHEGNL